MDKKKIIIFIVWLFLVILWNYGYPEASPFLDVLVALILAILQILISKVLTKFTN